MLLHELLKDSACAENNKYFIFIDDEPLSHNGAVRVCRKKGELIFTVKSSASQEPKVLGYNLVEELWRDTINYQFPSKSICKSLSISPSRLNEITVDLSPMMKVASKFKVKVDRDFKFVFINTPYYEYYKTFLCSDSKSQIRIEDKLPDNFEVREIIDQLTHVCFNNYFKYMRILYRSMRSPGIKHSSFLFCTDAVIPYLVYNNNLLNPFLDVTSIYENYKKSVYDNTDYTLNLRSNSGDTRLRCLNKLQLCKALGLKYFLNFSFDSITKIIGGLFFNKLPNTYSSVYLNIDERVVLSISKEQYDTLQDKSKFVESDEMMAFCRGFFKDFKTARPVDLYNILKECRLRPKEDAEEVTGYEILSSELFKEYMQRNNIGISEVWHSVY